MSILTAKQKSPSKIDIFQKLYQVLEVLLVARLFNFFKWTGIVSKCVIDI